MTSHKLHWEIIRLVRKSRKNQKNNALLKISQLVHIGGVI